LKCVASPTGAEGAVMIHADAALYAGLLDGGDHTEMALNRSRKAYVHLVRGSLQVNGLSLSGGDAALIEEESILRLTEPKDAEVLVFELAA